MTLKILVHFQGCKNTISLQTQRHESELDSLVLMLLFKPIFITDFLLLCLGEIDSFSFSFSRKN